MDKIDLRVIKVTVEVGEESKVYSGPMDIHVTGNKTTSSTPNNADIKISNLTAEVRNYLLTETSPFNKNRKKKRVKIEAGRESTGTTVVFIGDVTASSPTQPPDIGITLKSQTGAASKNNVVRQSGRSQEGLKDISGRVAKDMNLGLEFEADEKNIANYNFTGGAGVQVDALSRAGQSQAFVDDETLVVKKRGAARKGTKIILNKKSGMIGVPEVTETGVNVKMLFTPDAKIGGEVEITSDLNPSVNGNYEIYTLRFELSTRQEAFYYVAECKRLDKK